MKGYIYKIVNNKTGRFYIGSTNNLKRRCSDHITRLNHNYHPNKHLQEDFNKYGRDSFSVVTLLEFNGINRYGLYEEEKKYLNKLSEDMCYNIHLVRDTDHISSLRKPCYILDLKGGIVTCVDSKTAAMEWLGLNNLSNLNDSTKNPSSKVRSKMNGKFYRVVLVSYYDENRSEIEKYCDKYPDNIYDFKGEPMTVSEIARSIQLSYPTVSKMAKNGKFLKYSSNTLNR